MNSQLKALKVVAKALNRPLSDIGPEARMGETDGWDSLGHMRILLEAERVAGRQFDPQTAVEIIDIPTLEKALQQ